MSTNHGFLTAIAASAAITLLSGCAGSLSGGNGGEGSSGAGFDYGAAQSEVDSAIADLEPVTLTYQPGAASQTSTSAANSLAFQEYIEERSGGKITLEMVWGQSIAPHPEVEDALIDGRVDIAYHASIYFPDEFPTIDAFSKISQYATAAPLTGDAIASAMMADWAWNNDEHMEMLDDKGLVPLSPAVNSGDYWLACREPGSAPEDWKGRQIRIAGTAHSTIVQSMGASPVSMEYGELFEALQRGTVDCTFVQPSVAGSTGVLQVAPYVSHFADERMTSAVTAMNVAGSRFDSLPLAYQQIIFDAEAAHFHGLIVDNMDGGRQALIDAKEAGGDFSPMDPETEELMSTTQEKIVDDLIAEGRAPEDVREQLAALSDKWAAIVDELGYTDGGDWADFDEWYEPGSVDFRPLAERLLSEAAVQHRPA